jgi:hypothetical protein
VTAGPQRRRSPLFTVEIFELNGKNQGRFGNSRGSFGNRRRGRRFLLPRFSIPGFRWLKFASKQVPRHRGASVGGFGIKLFVCSIVRSFQLVKYDSKGLAMKPQEPLCPFSSFRTHLSASTFRHEQSNNPNGSKC